MILLLTQHSWHRCRPFQSPGLRRRADKAQAFLVSWAASADACVSESRLLVRSQAGSKRLTAVTCRILETISESLLLDSGVCGREEFRSGLGVGRGYQGPKGSSGGVQQEPAETAGLGRAAPSGSSCLRAPAQACRAHSTRPRVMVKPSWVLLGWEDSCWRLGPSERWAV